MPPGPGSAPQGRPAAPGLAAPFDAPVRLDAWEPDYGPEVAFDGDTPPLGRVDLGIEADDWAPIPAGPELGPRRVIAFVDGVRRMEARLVVPTAAGVAHGLLGSFAAGVVRGGGDEPAAFGESETRRVLVTGGGVLARHGHVAPDLVFTPTSVAALDPEAPVTAFHTAMRALEAELARERLAQGETVVLDGPLTFDASMPRGGIGLIKRLTNLHLPPERAELLERLPVGGRTPVFSLDAGGRFGRYSWFLRLADPPPGMTPLGGVVRLEVLEGLGAPGAIALAHLTAQRLPAFASSLARDARAPANLLPVGALEARLRHGLGDPELVRRRIQTAFARWARRESGAAQPIAPDLTHLSPTPPGQPPEAA